MRACATAKPKQYFPLLIIVVTLVFLLCLKPSQSNVDLYNYYEIESLVEYEKIPHRVWTKYRNASIQVFDSGSDYDSSSTDHHADSVVSQADWSTDGNMIDYHDHGTQVLNILASNHSSCIGIAPFAHIHVGKIFNFFNEASDATVEMAFRSILDLPEEKLPSVINLSFGSIITFSPIADNLLAEITGRGVVIVAAAGNFGPSYSTGLDPSTLPFVISVGGYDHMTETVALVSSKGFENRGFNNQIGNSKPDVLALFGPFLVYSKQQHRCVDTYGTSMAAPVVSALLAFSSQYLKIWNVAVAQQLLQSSTVKSSVMNRLQQGKGQINTESLIAALQRFEPKITLWPPSIDVTESPCVINQPYCTQPLFSSSPGLFVNITVNNPFSAAGKIASVTLGMNPELVNIIEFETLDCKDASITNFVTTCGLHFFVNKNIQTEIRNSIDVEFTIVDSQGVSHVAHLPVKLHLIPTPDVSKRVLWDVFHQHVYPWGFVPADYFRPHESEMEWSYDHPFANNWNLFRYLKHEGFYVDIWNQPLSCAELSNYGLLLILDPEDDFSTAEQSLIQQHMLTHKITTWIFADWFNSDRVRNRQPLLRDSAAIAKFTAGGANLPTLNQMLQPFGVHFSQQIVRGRPGYPYNAVEINYGSTIVQLPDHAWFRQDRLTTVPLTHFQPSFEVTAAWMAMMTIGSESRLIVVSDSTLVEDNASLGKFNTEFFDRLLGFSHYKPWSSSYLSQNFKNSTQIEDFIYEMPTDLAILQKQTKQHTDSQHICSQQRGASSRVSSFFKKAFELGRV